MSSQGDSSLNHHYLYDRHEEGEKRVGEIFLPFSKQEIMIFSELCTIEYCVTLVAIFAEVALCTYITRKPNYLYGTAIGMDVRYDSREIGGEGHCYSEREQKEGHPQEQRGEGHPQEEGRGYCHLKTRSEKNAKKYQKNKFKGAISTFKGH